MKSGIRCPFQMFPASLGLSALTKEIPDIPVWFFCDPHMILVKIPESGVTMDAFPLLLPIILIRFGLLNYLNKKAVKRAALFPKMIGGEKIAHWFYQLSNILIVLYLFFLKIKVSSSWFYPGLFVYSFGIIVCAVSVSNFANPERNGINVKGLYRLSRHPMYVGYFIYFLGCVLLTQSSILLALLAVFQISAHWIILSEERWCVEKFGDEYVDYMSKVRRYL
jgi:Putative protein-S-isoprenylcysteine methyltransferase